MKDKDNKPVNQWHMQDVRNSDIWGYRLMGKQGQMMDCSSLWTRATQDKTTSQNSTKQTQQKGTELQSDDLKRLFFLKDKVNKKEQVSTSQG